MSSFVLPIVLDDDEDYRLDYVDVIRLNGNSAPIAALKLIRTRRRNTHPPHSHILHVGSLIQMKDI